MKGENDPMARSHSDSGSVSDEASLELLFVFTISIMLCKSPVDGMSDSLELEAFPLVGLAWIYCPMYLKTVPSLSNSASSLSLIFLASKSVSIVPLMTAAESSSWNPTIPFSLSFNINHRRVSLKPDFSSLRPILTAHFSAFSFKSSMLFDFFFFALLQNTWSDRSFLETNCQISFLDFSSFLFSLIVRGLLSSFLFFSLSWLRAFKAAISSSRETEDA